MPIAVAPVAPESRRKGWTHTAEARARIAAALKGRPPANKGRTHTAEARARMSAIRKAQWLDPGYRARMMAARKEWWRDLGYRARQSAVSKAQWLDPEYRARQSAAREAKRLGPIATAPPSGHDRQIRPAQSEAPRPRNRGASGASDVESEATTGVIPSLKRKDQHRVGTP